MNIIIEPEDLEGQEIIYLDYSHDRMLEAFEAVKASLLQNLRDEKERIIAQLLIFEFDKFTYGKSRSNLIITKENLDMTEGSLQRLIGISQVSNIGDIKNQVRLALVPTPNKGFLLLAPDAPGKMLRLTYDLPVSVKLWLPTDNEQEEADKIKFLEESLSDAIGSTLNVDDFNTEDVSSNFLQLMGNVDDRRDALAVNITISDLIQGLIRDHEGEGPFQFEGDIELPPREEMHVVTGANLLNADMRQYDSVFAR